MDKLFVFDMGGVVVQNFVCWPRITEKLGICASPETLQRRYSGLLQALERGNVSSMEFLLLLSRREHIPEPAENYWKTFFTPVLDSQTVQIIHKLKEAGYRCVCGTNTIDVHYEYHLTHGQYDCFDAVYASHLMGQIKPDITFWYAILGEENRLYRENKSKLKFGDMLFFDDNRDNVAAAASLGIQSYLFTTAGKAAAEISSATGPAL